MPTFPERVLEAYHRWREQATAHGFTPAQLPNDDVLSMAAQDSQAINNPDAPTSLKVWGGPLQRLRLMVATGFEEATFQPLEPAMFTPNLPGGVWPSSVSPEGSDAAMRPGTQPAPTSGAPGTPGTPGAAGTSGAAPHTAAMPEHTAAAGRSGAPVSSAPTEPRRRGADTMVDDILGLSSNRSQAEPTPLDQGLDDGSLWPAGNPSVGTAGPIPRATLRATSAPVFPPADRGAGTYQPVPVQSPQDAVGGQGAAMMGGVNPTEPALTANAMTANAMPDLNSGQSPMPHEAVAQSDVGEDPRVVPSSAPAPTGSEMPAGPAEASAGSAHAMSAHAMTANAMPANAMTAIAMPGQPGGGINDIIVPVDSTTVAALAQPMDDVIVDQALVDGMVEETEIDDSRLYTNPDDARDYVDTDFARLVMFAEGAPEALEEAVVEAHVQHDGTVAVTWEAPAVKEGRVRLYRVVSEEEEFDRDPESGEHRHTTVGHHGVDEDEFTTALRFYQVWAHEGTTEATARNNPPQFVGEAWIIQPVGDMTLTVAGREIKGQWSPLEGTTRVAVFAAKERDRRVHSPRNEISLNEANQQGFIFSPPQRGVNWKFVARRIVTLRGFDRYSAMSDVDMIAVPAEVHAVDIAVDTTVLGDETLFDVSWDNPSSGEVRIYRTNVAPDDGVTGRTVDVRFLEDFGLPQENWVNDLTRGENSCRVPWPEDWYSIFLTPVTVVGEKCQVGRSFSAVRVGEVTNAQLFERVTHQVATFGWPRNALEVAAYFVSEDPYTGQTSEEHLTTIDRETYDARGGMRLKLNDRGRIKLLPSKYYNNEKILGEPAVLDYHGVTRMKYSIFGRGGAVCIAIAALRPEHVERRFTLRIQRGRLPLEAGDGLEVNVRQMTGGAPHSEFLPGLIVDHLGPDNPTTYWEIDPRMLTKAGPNAFLRLFPLDLVDKQGRAIALEDPPVAYLHLRRLRDIIARSMYKPGAALDGKRPQATGGDKS